MRINSILNFDENNEQHIVHNLNLMKNQHKLTGYLERLIKNDMNSESSVANEECRVNVQDFFVSISKEMDSYRLAIEKMQANIVEIMATGIVLDNSKLAIKLENLGNSMVALKRKEEDIRQTIGDNYYKLYKPQVRYIDSINDTVTNVAEMVKVTIQDYLEDIVKYVNNTQYIKQLVSEKHTKEIVIDEIINNDDAEQIKNTNIELTPKEEQIISFDDDNMDVQLNTEPENINIEVNKQFKVSSALFDFANRD